MKKLGVKKVVELGCGLGFFTKRIHSEGFDVLGVDISPTAIQKAKQNHPECNFRVGDILDYDNYTPSPDVIIFAHIVWYVLEKLDAFLELMKTSFPDVYFISLDTFYPPGVQKYGREKFTNLSEMMSYFGMNYLEWGELYEAGNDTIKTFFLGRFS